jgi:DNA-binding transcriptional MerR regulator
VSYTVKQLAKLSGVSIRTLHFYDEIGLLKPAYCAENGYRYYEKEQLLLLQQILFFKELGFQLVAINKIVNSKEFDKVIALKSHKQILLQRIHKMQQMITTIDKTIFHLQGETIMQEHELYYGLNSQQQQSYEQYLIDHVGINRDELNQSREKFKNWTQAEWDEYRAACDSVHRELVVALIDNLDPADAVVQRIMRQHYTLFSTSATQTKQGYLSLAELLEFLIAAMQVFATNHLS